MLVKLTVTMFVVCSVVTSFIGMCNVFSFGYCEKVTVGNVKPIGHYGNGFKSGSMRLGLDAMVFTRGMAATSVGFLSQTYLKATNAEAVVVPIVTWELTPNGSIL